MRLVTLLLLGLLSAPAWAAPAVTVGSQPFPGTIRHEGTRTLVDLDTLIERLDLWSHPVYHGLCVNGAAEGQSQCAAKKLAGPGRVIVKGTPVTSKDGLVDLQETAAALGLPLERVGTGWALAPKAPAPKLAPGRKDLRVNVPGADVDLPKTLVPGRWNVVYYYVDWCPACWQMGPALKRLARTRDSMALLEIDILDFNTPVAVAHKVKASPTIRIYDGKGRLVVEDDRAREWLLREFGFEYPTRLKCLGTPGEH